jgi:hypothetical protein
MAKTKDTAGPKKRTDVYTMLSAITFVALVTGAVLIHLDYDEYGQKQAEKEKVPALPRLGTIPAAPPPAPPMTEPMPDQPMGENKEKDKDKDKDMDKEKEKGKDGGTGLRDAGRPGWAAAFVPVAIPTAAGPVAFADRAPLPLPRLGPADPAGFDALPGLAPPGR